MHPRRSARLIEELEEENVQLRGEVAQLKEGVSKLSASSQAGSAALEEAARRNAEERGMLLAEIERLKGELEEWEEMRPELERVAEAMEKIEDMKREYAEKMEKMQRRLDDARHGSFRRPKTAPAPSQGLQGVDFSETERNEQSDILDFEGESPFIEPQIPKPRAKKASPSHSEDEDNWLKPLPD